LTVIECDRGGSRQRLSAVLGQAAERESAVMAFNVVDPASMAGVLDAAEEACAPVVVQLSVRSVRQWGVRAALACHTEACEARSSRSVLHLDHCTDPALAADCLRAGWDSVLFDASRLPYDTALRETTELVALAREYGGDVEGEFEAIPRVGQHHDGGSRDVERAVEFVERTGVTCFSPDLGTAHGTYTRQPVVDHERARVIAAATSVPLVLHGGSGLDLGTVAQLVDCGVRKINVSTQVKDAYLGAVAGGAGTGEPLELLARVSGAVREVAAGYFRVFGRRR
jgi:fructose-bisphosphate aldolase class II